MVCKLLAVWVVLWCTAECDLKVSCVRNFGHGKQTGNHKLNKQRYRTGLHTAADQDQRNQTGTNKLLLIRLSTGHTNFVRAKCFLFLACDVKSEEKEEGWETAGNYLEIL